mgnify:FL=1
MNRSFVLFRLSLKQLIWQMARTFGGRKKFSPVLILLAASLLIGLSGLYSWSMIAGVPESMNLLIPLSILSAAFGLILVFGFYHAQGYLFDFRDYDLLFSMPLSRRQILMSKLIALIAMMLLYSAFLTLPMMVLFQLHYAMPLTFLLYGLIGQLFLPLIPMTVACLAAVLVRLISSRVKHPVLIRNLLSLGMVIGLMAVMTLFQSQTGQAQDVGALIRPIQTGLAPVYWLTMAMMQGSFGELLKLIGASSLVLLLFLAAIAPLWNTLNQKARMTSAQAGGRMKVQSSSMNAALFRRELRRYFASTSLVMNTLVGPVMVALCAVMLAVQKDLMVQVMLESGMDFSAFADPVAMLLLAVCLFCGMICPVTATSISLEGKNFWIVRSLPIPAGRYLGAKLALDLALNIPVSWLSILILSVVYHFSLLTVVLLLTLTLLAILCSGLFGLIINLHFPRFDFDREIVVVKQSLSTMITVLAGMGASFLILAVLLFWAPLESSLMMMVIALVLILLATGMGIYLIRRGEALLSKLSGV